jgi:hypothetical protein
MSLRDALFNKDHTLRIIAAEGDSQDGTRKALPMFSILSNVHLQLLDVSHGGPWFGSVVSIERMQALSQIANSIFSEVCTIDDVLVYVESDLLWDSKTMLVLIEAAAARQKEFDVHVPMIFAGEAFYDIWAYRNNGESFDSQPPYHSSLNGDGIIEVDSAGSCLVMPSKVARQCRIRDDNCLVGWCADAREHGYRIGVHAQLRIDHP